MTPQQLVAVGARMFALWLGVQAFMTTFRIVEATRDELDRAIVPTILSFAMLAMLAIVLWFFPMTVAHKLVRSKAVAAPTPGTPLPDREKAALWLSTGATLIGLWMLSTVLPEVATWIVLTGTYGTGAFDSQQVVWFVVHHVVALLMGAWLLIGAPGLHRVIAWARTAGLAADRV